jgi:uncharacterized protein involved in exopolysaccharide biosynthesis
MIPGFTNFPLLDLASTALRSWWTIVAGVCLGLAAATLALDHMPRQYMATATIWVNRQQVPDSVAKTDNFDEMSRQLVFFRQAVLTEEYMVELVRRTYGLPTSAEELRSLIGKVRSSVSVAISASRRKGLNAFELSYSDVNPERAALVANELAELYIAQNEEFRSGSAERSAELIESLAADARAEFNEIDDELTRFKRAHQYETTAFLDTNRGQLESAKSELRSVQQKWALADTRLRALKSKTDEPGAVNLEIDGDSGVIDPRSLRVAQLTMELEALRVRYSERHPDYIRKKRELDDVLSGAVVAVPSTTPGEPSVPYIEPTSSAIADEIAILEREQELLVGQERQLKRDIAEYRRRIDNTPEIQGQLDELNRRHSMARDRYLRRERDADTAETTVELEESEMGVGMEIARAATVPRVPVSPKPLYVGGLGAIFGLLLFFGPVLARALIRPLVVSEAGFATLSEIPVLASLPTIHTPQSQKASRKWMLRNVVLAMMSCTALLFAVLFVRLG